MLKSECQRHCIGKIWDVVLECSAYDYGRIAVIDKDQVYSRE